MYKSKFFKNLTFPNWVLGFCFTIFFIDNPTGTDTAENLCLGRAARLVPYFITLCFLQCCGPDSLNPETNPAFQANPDPVPEKNTAEILFVYSKIAKKASKLQEKPSALKGKHPTLQKMKFINWCIFFLGHFFASGIRIQGPYWILIQSGYGSGSTTLVSRVWRIQ